MLIALALAASVLGQTPSLEVAASVSSAQNMTVDELAIREGAAAWADAFTRGDVDLVDALLADDFVGTAKDGSPYDKPTLLGWVRAGPNLSASETTVDRIRFFGDIAIATDRTQWSDPRLRCGASNRSGPISGSGATVGGLSSPRTIWPEHRTRESLETPVVVLNPRT